MFKQKHPLASCSAMNVSRVEKPKGFAENPGNYLLGEKPSKKTQ